MHELRHLRQLATQGIGRHVQAPHGSVQPGHAVGFLSAAARLPKAQTGDTRNGGRKSNLACAVIRRTADNWGVM